jgi:Protein of unknown function DUF2834
MKTTYLILAIIGFIAPNIPVVEESCKTGNWLFWLDPAATLNGMFGNAISTAFIIDLLIAVLVFFIWTYAESKKYGIKRVWLYWIITMLFGLGGTLPLFLYIRESKKYIA